MIACGKCGNQNPLGRVFCTTCGAKLELLAITKEHVEKRVTKWYVPVIRFFTRLILALIIAGVAMAGMAVWPGPAFTGEAGAAVDAKRAKEMFARARMKSRGATARPITLTEKQINAYLETRVKDLKITSAVVSVTNDALSMRLVIPLKQPDPLALPSEKSKIPTLTADIVWSVINDAFHVQKVTIGHLPLPGPLGPLVLDKFVAPLKEDKDWLLLSSKFNELTAKPKSISGTPKP